jgi:hypothetical protein
VMEETEPAAAMAKPALEIFPMNFLLSMIQDFFKVRDYS